jgi:hypothetical protein
MTERHLVWFLIAALNCRFIPEFTLGSCFAVCIMTICRRFDRVAGCLWLGGNCVAATRYHHAIPGCLANPAPTRWREDGMAAFGYSMPSVRAAVLARLLLASMVARAGVRTTRPSMASWTILTCVHHAGPGSGLCPVNAVIAKGYAPRNDGPVWLMGSPPVGTSDQGWASPGVRSLLNAYYHLRGFDERLPRHVGIWPCAATRTSGPAVSGLLQINAAYFARSAGGNRFRRLTFARIL